MRGISRWSTGSPQNPGGLLRQAGDLDGSVQLPHPLPQTEEDGDAGTVHKGDAGAVHNELAGEHLVNGLVQVLENPLDPVVVNLPRQGDGEDAVVGGIGDRHGKNPFLWWVVKNEKTPCTQVGYTAVTWMFVLENTVKQGRGGWLGFRRCEGGL